MTSNVLISVINEVSNALLPLQQVTTKSRTIDLFAKLGYTLPDTNDFQALPSDLITKIGDVITGITVLLNASSDSDRLQKAIDLGGKIGEVADEISKIKTALETAGASLNDFVSKAQLSELPERLLDYLIVTYLVNFYPGPYSFMLLMGLIEEIAMPADPAKVQPAFTLNKVWWDRLPKLLSDPRGLANDVYQWETNFDSNLFLTRLERILRGFMLPGGLYTQSDTVKGGLGNPAGTKEIRMPLLQAGNTPELYSQFGLLISPIAANGPKKKGLALMPYTKGVANMAFNLNNSYEIKLTTSGSIDNGVGIVLRPVLNLEAITTLFTAPAAATNFNIKMEFKKKATATAETILFGSVDGSRVSVKGVAFSAFASKQSDKVDFGIEFGIDEARVVISAKDADGFLKKILEGIEVDSKFSIGFGYSAKNGVYFTGSGGLEIILPLHIALGPVTIESALIGLRLGAGGTIPIDLAGSIKAQLGPITVVVQNMGITAELSFPPDGKGNMGPMNLTPGFKPPNGIGLSIDAGVVKGGGFILFDIDKGQYAGALELSIQNTIQVAAIAVITTKMPDGSEGFSLLIIIGVTFTPGIVLGMGFFLSGLGGMLGINRTINVDSMREGVKTGAIDNILFPEDVVNNIMTIITQITTIFPPKKDQFIIGLMARITWGVPKLATIDFGLAVEFASPVRIAILGVVKIVLPTEEAAILQLQINFLGVIDFEKGMLSFDASLFNSRILTFTLEGDMALRLGWGQTKAFLLSVGGFHPSFKPPAELKVGSMTRLTVNILTGNPRLVLTCYFAVTSNTVQFGARLDLKFSVSEFSIVGYLYFDVLFQFSPFHFIANIGAGLEVKMGSTTLFSITLDFELSGPTPWNANGTASFSILFFTIKVHFNETWGENNSVKAPSIAVLPKLMDAMKLDANWTTELPSSKSTLVALRDIPPKEGEVVLQPHGSFKITQTIAPIGQVLEKFGNAVPSDIKKLEVGSVVIGSMSLTPNYANEMFAPAMFKNMQDKDKLSAPSYESMKSGIKVTETDNIVVNGKANRKVEYEVKISDFDPTPRKSSLTLQMSLLRRMTRGGAVGKSVLSRDQAYSRLRQKDATTKVQEESFVIINKSNRQKVGANKFTQGSYSDAVDAVARLKKENPLADIQVAPSYHFEMA